MSTYTIPKTSVEATILPLDPVTGFAALFLSGHETGNGKYMASVNAGTSNSGSVFKVGVGGINLGFKTALSHAGQATDLYMSIHQGLYDSLTGTDLSTARTDFTDTDPVILSLIQKPDPTAGLPQYDGIVFIDVFNPKQYPKGNKLNYAMVYVVPPDASNYSDGPSFMHAIKTTSETIIKALNAYNTQYADGSEYMKIEDIRMCLYSGEIYRGPYPKTDVAENNIAGLSSGIQALKASGGSEEFALVEFEAEVFRRYLDS